MPSRRLPSLFRWAASDGVVQTVELHIRRGDDVNARDSRGRTPLLLAAAGGHSEVCQLLIKAGADPSLVDWEGNDALSVAIKERQEDAAAVLRACRPSESADSASSAVVVDDPFAGVADVEWVWDEEPLDLADWEEVADSSPPEDDPSVYSSVRELQDQISKHVPTNQDDDWSDVEVDLPDDTDWYTAGHAAWLDDVRTLIRAGLSCGWVTAYEVAELAWNEEDDQYDIGTESRLRVMMEAIGILVEDDPGAPVSASVAWPQSDVILDDSDEEMVQDAIAFLGGLSRNQDLLIPYSKDLNGAQRLSADEEVALATRIEDATDEVFSAITQSTEASHQLFEWADQLENSTETDAELSTEDSGGDEEFDSGEGQDSDRPSLTPSMSHNLTGSQAIRHLNGSSLGDRDAHRADTFRDGLSALRLSGVAIRRLCATVTENASNPELNRILTSALRAREKASAEFVEANLRLVLWCAKRQGGLPLMDRVQEGSIGLLKAVERFDPRLGFRFSTYATWWIRQAISRAVADQGRIIRLPVHAVERLAKVQRAAGAASALTGRPPDASELASEFGVSGRELEKTLLLRQDAELVENVVDWSPAMDTPLTAEADFASRFAIRHDIDFALRFLTERQADVIRFRFGLGGGPDHTLQQVGDKLNLTRERVRQIEVAALKKLRRVVSSRYGTGGKRVS